jgi:anti-sigma factor RsiW
MNCNNIRENLFRYTDHMMPEEERSAFEAHLNTCTECSATVSGTLSFESLIEKEKAAEPSPFAATRILQRLESESERGVYHHRQRISHLLQPALVAASLILALFIGFVIGRNGGLKTDTKAVNIRQVDNLRSDLFIPDFIDEEQSLLSNK